MNKEVIYRKTAKGQEELASRTYRLASRERSILILVDGKTTGADLIDKSRHFGDSAAYLEHLIADGFIEPVDGTSPVPAAVPASAPKQEPMPAATASPATLKDTVKFARHYLLQALGPDADALVTRIEASRNLSDLAAALGKGRDALRAILGQRKADQFWQEVIARLPQLRSTPR